MSVNAILQGQEGKKTRWQCNPNLLDNWYFVGGGSQQGGGQFPINQRGQTEYINPGVLSYAIDRWFSQGEGVKVSINEGYVSVGGANTSCWFGQKFEYTLNLDATYTFSILTYEGVLLSITFKGLGYHPFIDPRGSGLNVELVSANWMNLVTASGQTINIVAVKLELGDRQTLAHKEGDTWVLNKAPDYGEELAKCQRYYWASEMFYSANAPSVILNSYLICNVKFPVKMRAIPNITITAVDGTKNAVSDWASQITVRTDVVCNTSALSRGGFSSISSATGFDSANGAYSFKVIADANL